MVIRVKKDGFTLVELLGIIVILAILMTLLIPMVNRSSTGAKKKTYETKVKMIEDAAVLYGQDNYRKIIDNAKKALPGYSSETKNDVTYYIQTIKVTDLVPNYYTADNEETGKMIADPRNNNNYLDICNIEVKINPNSRKVSASYKLGDSC
ncbi:MAG TPA: hypothetical protein DCY94_03505 [Firmicutes bacterium]|nr:hypothetical protein [Bacillota bacterium]